MEWRNRWSISSVTRARSRGCLSAPCHTPQPEPGPTQPSHDTTARARARAHAHPSDGPAAAAAYPPHAPAYLPPTRPLAAAKTGTRMHGTCIAAGTRTGSILQPAGPGYVQERACTGSTLQQSRGTVRHVLSTHRACTAASSRRDSSCGNTPASCRARGRAESRDSSGGNPPAAWAHGRGGGGQAV